MNMRATKLGRDLRIGDTVTLQHVWAERVTSICHEHDQVFVNTAAGWTVFGLDEEVYQ